MGWGGGLGVGWGVGSWFRPVSRERFHILLLGGWPLPHDCLSSLLLSMALDRIDMSSHVYAIRAIEKSRASCPGGRFPPSFIHQVIVITGLNKLYDCMFSP